MLELGKVAEADVAADWEEKRPRTGEVRGRVVALMCLVYAYFLAVVARDAVDHFVVRINADVKRLFFHGDGHG